MKKISLLFLFAFMGIAIVSNAVNPVRISTSTLRDEERKVSNFNGIGINGSIKAYVKMGSTESLRLEGDQEVINELVTEVKDGILTIRPKSSQWKEWFKKHSNAKITAYITAKQLTSLAISGSGSIEVENAITANAFNVALSGSGKIKATVNTQTFDGAISGSGTLSFSGKAKNTDLAISGSGNFQGQGFSSQEVDVHVSGSGSVYIHAEKSIDAAVSGSGNIIYTGNPNITKAVSGSGKVRKAD